MFTHRAEFGERFVLHWAVLSAVLPLFIASSFQNLRQNCIFSEGSMECHLLWHPSAPIPGPSALPEVCDTPTVFPKKLALDDPEKTKRDPPSSQFSVAYRFINSFPKISSQIILVVAVCVQWVETNIRIKCVINFLGRQLSLSEQWLRCISEDRKRESFILNPLHLLKCNTQCICANTKVIIISFPVSHAPFYIIKHLFHFQTDTPHLPQMSLEYLMLLFQRTFTTWIRTNLFDILFIAVDFVMPTNSAAICYKCNGREGIFIKKVGRKLQTKTQWSGLCWGRKSLTISLSKNGVCYQGLDWDTLTFLWRLLLELE